VFHWAELRLLLQARIALLSHTGEFIVSGRANRQEPMATGVAVAHAESDEPTTVRPPFDPAEFARQSEVLTIPPPPALPGADLQSGVKEALRPTRGTSVPALVVAAEDLEWFELPAPLRALLELIDGEASIEAIGLRAGLPLGDVLDAFDDLARERLIAYR
jgi:hypothetical protein